MLLQNSGSAPELEEEGKNLLFISKDALEHPLSDELVHLKSHITLRNIGTKN